MRRVNGIYLIGREWSLSDPRAEALRRLPRDVANLILAVRYESNLDRFWIALRRDNPIDRDFVSEYLDIIEDDISRESPARDQAPTWH